MEIICILRTFGFYLIHYIVDETVDIMNDVQDYNFAVWYLFSNILNFTILSMKTDGDTT